MNYPIFKFKMINKVNLKSISYFANVILLFSVILDPSNLFLGIKDIAFIFFVAVSFFDAKIKNVFILIAFLTMYFITFTFGLLASQKMDLDFSFATLKSFLFLLYLFWMNNDYLEICSIFYKLTIIMGIIVIIIYFLMNQSLILEGIIYSFMGEKDFFVTAGRRTILGTKLFYVHYRSSAICVISLSLALYFLFSRRKFKYFIHFCILFLCLLISGTRANMLSAILISIFVMLFYLLYKKKSIMIFTILINLVCIFGSLIIFLLLTEANRSTQIKMGHQESMFSIFSENPIRFLLIGTGPGSLYYSLGFDGMTPQSELTYLELIRNYGLVFTLIIIYLFCIPFIKIINNKQYDKLLKFSLFIGYISYLFIAGTNPLLINSNGFIVFSIMFYISQNNILKEIK